MKVDFCGCLHLQVVVIQEGVPELRRCAAFKVSRNNSALAGGGGGGCYLILQHCSMQTQPREISQLIHFECLLCEKHHTKHEKYTLYGFFSSSTCRTHLHNLRNPMQNENVDPFIQKAGRRYH